MASFGQFSPNGPVQHIERIFLESYCSILYGMVPLRKPNTGVNSYPGSTHTCISWYKKPNTTLQCQS
uniref:Uncharacterized protein n=1 Tax=Arundo donax TaxID=35708 RepID=A0A0A9CDW0_ARUDO